MWPAAEPMSVPGEDPMRNQRTWRSPTRRLRGWKMSDHTSRSGCLWPVHGYWWGSPSQVASTRGRRFDLVVPQMLVACACGLLAIVCAVGAVRGWRFPFTKSGGKGSGAPNQHVLNNLRPGDGRGTADSTDNGYSGGDASSPPINMDKFSELRESTRPAPLSDPATASRESDQACRR